MTLTTEIIDSTSDTDLPNVIINFLLDKIPDDISLEYNAVMSFSEAQRNFYITYYLVFEVDNGGFYQFFHNRSVQYAHLAEYAMKAVCGDRFAEIISRAVTVFDSEDDEVLESMLNHLDDEYYDLCEIVNIEQLQTDFIRKHKYSIVQ